MENLNKVNNYILIILFAIFPVLLIFAWVDKQNQIKRTKNLNKLFEEHINKQIEKLREKFRYDLIGEWKLFEGTFSNVMNESWTFNQDGSGKIKYRGVMSGEFVNDFKWRRKGELNIEISYFDKDAKDPVWRDVRYDFCKIQTDCGGAVCLIEVDADEKQKKGFGLSNIPLSYEGSNV